jgi:hypothetical protein
VDELIRREHGGPAVPVGRMELPQVVEPLGPAEAAEPTESEPTIFTLLAERARRAPGAHLVAAAVLGGVDAALFGRAHPALWWVAAGSVSLAAYGCWGLADRALAEDGLARGRRLALRVLRDGAAVAGCVAALGVLFGFMAAALGGWRH